jgi:glycosyltransferase involved in cell wall biosynthesis
MTTAIRCPLSVLIAVRNEENNLPRCVDALRGWADEVVVVDSQSTDRTAAIAEAAGATVVQFRYRGGWPKKRQWALDTYPFRNEWVLILDADEVLLEPVKQVIASAIRPGVTHDGFFLRFHVVFLSRMLRFGSNQLWKLALIRKGRARYERRLLVQDASMQDMEIHEHVVVDGSTGRLKSPIRHENVNRLDRYIEKHNAYSNWEARVVLEGNTDDITPSLFGTQAQRRRWLKRAFLKWPGSPLVFFLYKYVFRLGFADGIPGLIYCAFQGIQFFHIKAKIYELRLRRAGMVPETGGTAELENQPAIR